jgi:hypothetical protein
VFCLTALKSLEKNEGMVEVLNITALRRPPHSSLRRDRIIGWGFASLFGVVDSDHTAGALTDFWVGQGARRHSRSGETSSRWPA